MADNVTLNSGSGGAVLATDDVSGVHYQVNKLAFGALDSATVVVATAGLPVAPETGSTWTVDGSGVTQPISAASLPLPTGAATEATLGTLSGKVTACNTGAVVVSSGTITTVSSVTAIANALPAGDNNIGNVDIVTMPADTFVAEDGALGKGVLIQGDDGTDRTNVLVDTDGHLQVDVLSGASGGTAYTEDVATANPIVGTATMMERDDTITTLTPAEGDWASFRCSAEGALWVQDFNSDAILADTAAMVVDLAAIEVLLTGIDVDTDAIKTSVEVMDDWDESDRAKVNVIAGQAGIAAGTGVDGATVPRVSLVTDVALPTGNNNIGNVDIVTLPGGNLGMQAMAASLSIVPASDITDGTYIGDIKFGESIPAGTNAIGKLASNSGVDIGDVDVLSIAAGTNTIGGAIAQQSTSVAYDGTTACTIKRATGLAASGTVAMVAAVGGKKIRVLALFLKATSATATNVYVANDDNDIFGDASNPIPLAVDANGDNDSGFVLPWNPGGWCETDTVNEALNVILSAAQDVIYAITYIEVA